MVVHTPDVAGPPQQFGVNFAGGTFDPEDDLFAKNPAYRDYYQATGLTLIRVPFHWQEVQPDLDGPLNMAIVKKMSTMLALADARGMKVIFDMHNYGHYEGESQVIESAAVSYANYQNVWDRLSSYFASHPHKAAIFGFDIMNEPKQLGENWLVALKCAIAGIRANDMSTLKKYRQ